MTREIALHLGAHKTATTTIQREFLSRKRELLRRGVHFIGRSQIREEGGLRFPKMGMSSKRLRRIQNYSAQLLDALISTSVPNSCNRLILSEENIMGTPRLMIQHLLLYPGLRARLGVLPTSLNDGSTHVFLSVRNYASFFASCHSTAAQRGIWLPFGPSERTTVLGMPRRWPDVVADIQSRLPKAQLTIWRYEDLHDVGERVISAMVGHDFSVNFEEQTNMRSPSAEVMSKIEALSRQHIGTNPPRQKIKELLRFSEGSAVYNPWHDEERTWLSELYHEDCNAIAEMKGARVVIPPETRGI